MFRLITYCCFTISLTIGLCSNVLAQNELKDKLDLEIDSLKQVIKTTSVPADKVKNMIRLSWKYGDRGRPTLNLDVLLKARNLADSFQLQEPLANACYALGVFYNRQNKEQQGINFCHQSLQIYSTINDTLGVGAATHRLGLCFYSLNQLDSAKYYLLWSYKIRKIINYKYPVAASSNALGLVLMKQDSSKLACQYFHTAYHLWKDLEDLEGVSIVGGNLGVSFREQGQMDSALFYLKESLVSANKANALVFAKESALELSKTYEILNQSDSALTYLKIYNAARDSIFNLEGQSKLVEMQEKYQSLESEKTILLQSGQLEGEKWKQKVLFLIIFSILIVLILMYVAFRAKRKANEKLSEQKIQIEEQNEELNQQNEEIISISDMVESQNQVLKQRNEEILDSINYAYKIQQGILPALSPLNSITSDAFVYFNPKEIVSGDFYWLYQKDNILMWAVVDCTGHGVPGALMSMVGFNGLNKIVQGDQITEPSIILEKLTEHIILSNSNVDLQKEDEELKDGLDIALCKLDLTTNVLTFSGAFNSCYIIRGGVLSELKGTRKPVGKYWSKKDKVFKSETFNLESNDWIMLSSDGYPDQFGGAKNKKFGYPNFRKTILNIAESKPAEQVPLLEAAFQKWKDKNEQVDDVCVLGVKIK